MIAGFCKRLRYDIVDVGIVFDNKNVLHFYKNLFYRDDGIVLSSMLQ